MVTNTADKANVYTAKNETTVQHKPSVSRPATERTQDPSIGSQARLTGHPVMV